MEVRLSVEGLPLVSIWGSLTAIWGSLTAIWGSLTAFGSRLLAVGVFASTELITGTERLFGE